jgi:hypothetical protein
MSIWIPVAVVLFVIAAGLGLALLRERSRRARLTRTATLLAGHARNPDMPFPLLFQGDWGDDGGWGWGGWGEEPEWRLIASGGNTQAGKFANRGICPCQHTYTVATNFFPINAWPNPVPNPLRAFPWNTPPSAPEPWKCPGNCVLVATKVWRGWDVIQGANGKLEFQAHTFTQYHCKPPNDPDIGKPPEGAELPPRPPEVEEPPKPGEVTP